MPHLVPRLLVVEQHLLHNLHKLKQIIMIKKVRCPVWCRDSPSPAAAPSAPPPAAAPPPTKPAAPSTLHARGTYLGNIQATFKQCSGKIQGMFKARSGDGVAGKVCTES